jgi:hypothetical protein
VSLAVTDTPDVMLRAAHEQAIHALIVRVGWAIDHSDLAVLASCLHPNVAFVRPDGQVLQGPQAVCDAYAQRDPDRITRHVLSNGHLTWPSPDRVQAHTTVLLWTGRLSDEATAAGRPADPVQKLGEHRDVLAFEAGRWCLLRRQSEFVLFR